ncbi:hypothetical protein [Streptomyces sp. R08]|uniref:Uncharacterized protein n=1 Tax=Streptomyces sp. R08 TaxID=3238624 RepID=A0AB39MIM3_9ACTN
MDTERGHENVSGTREELVSELRDRATGWHHMASDKKRDRALEAAESLEAGSFSVKVGNTIYSVTGEGIPSARDESADEPVS